MREIAGASASTLWKKILIGGVPVGSPARSGWRLGRHMERREQGESFLVEQEANEATCRRFGVHVNGESAVVSGIWTLGAVGGGLRKGLVHPVGLMLKGFCSLDRLLV